MRNSVQQPVIAYQDKVDTTLFPYKRCAATLKIEHLEFLCTQPKGKLHFRDGVELTHTASFSSIPDSPGYIKDALAAIYWHDRTT